MTISKTPQKTVKSAEAFIDGAPDSPPKTAKKAGKKVAISLQMQPALLQRVDELAAQMGQSRAALIALAVHELLERRVTLSARP